MRGREAPPRRNVIDLRLKVALWTNTINYGKDLPLAQGIRFEVWPWGTRVRLTAG